MIIKTLVVSPFQQNARLILDELTGKATVVDPGDEIERILAAVDLKRYEIVSILITHSHIDHVGGLAKILRTLAGLGKPKPLVYAHKAESLMRANITTVASLYGLSTSLFENAPEPDQYMDQGDRIKIGSLESAFLFTPGHSPGHLAVYFENPGTVSLLNEAGASLATLHNTPIVFSGDALFAGSIGRTDLPGGDTETLLKSIRTHLFTLPPQTRVLSGHGGDSTIDLEKRTNPFFN